MGCLQAAGWGDHDHACLSSHHLKHCGHFGECCLQLWRILQHQQHGQDEAILKSKNLMTLHEMDVAPVGTMVSCLDVNENIQCQKVAARASKVLDIITRSSKINWASMLFFFLYTRCMFILNWNIVFRFGTCFWLRTSTCWKSFRGVPQSVYIVCRIWATRSDWKDLISTLFSVDDKEVAWYKYLRSWTGIMI